MSGPFERPPRGGRRARREGRRRVYREQYGVIVICRDERHQRRVYAALRRAGHAVRVVVT